jgi:hypothetical protein
MRYRAGEAARPVGEWFVLKGEEYCSTALHASIIAEKAILVNISRQVVIRR